MRVFISHAKKNRQRAERLAIALQGLGIDVWFDEWEILVGHNLADQIYNGIKSSDYMLVLLTRSSVESLWVKEEMDFAKTTEIETGGTKIVPLLYENCEIPPALKAKVFADFRTSFQKGLGKLTKLLAPIKSSTTSYVFQTSVYEIEIPLNTRRALVKLLPWALLCLDASDEEFEENLRRLKSTIEILIEQAQYRNVDNRCYTWLTDIFHMVSKTDILAEDTSKLGSKLFKYWYEGMPLYCGGLIQKLPLNSRIAFEVGRAISGHGNEDEKLSTLHLVCRELQLSDRFFKLVTAKNIDLQRIIDALSIELSRIQDYQRLREYYRKHILSKGLWAGYGCTFALVFLESDNKEYFHYYFSSAAEYILAELNNFEACTEILDVSLNLMNYKGDVYERIGIKLWALYENLNELAMSWARESVSAQAFCLGLQLGLISFNEVDELTPRLIHDVEILGIQLHVSDNLLKRIQSVLDEIFYEGEKGKELIHDLVTDIATSIESGESCRFED